MKKFIGMVDKSKVNGLMKISKRLHALSDLKSTLLDLQDHPHQEIDISGINIEEIDNEIIELTETRLDKLEGIRLHEGWDKEIMDKIQINADCKAYINKDK